MRTLVTSLIFGLSFFNLNSTHAAEPLTSPCFNFSKPSTTLLHSAPATFEADKDPSDFGTDAKTNNDWGQISGIVKKPILELSKKLQDPKTIRNGSNTKVAVNEVESKDFLKRIDQTIVIKPVFFLTIEWKEAWAFALKDGKAEKPESMVISYQKTEGTSHVKHLCGNIFLKSITPDSTGVYLYEEVQADRRSAKDVVDGLSGTLRTLRE